MSDSLRRFFGSAPIQHVGINVTDMEESKKFYAEVFGGEFVAEIDGITGANWNTVLNGTALADGKNVPDLAEGDALHVAFYSFGNTAIELLRYYNVKTGETFPGPVVPANEQGPAGMHTCFNLAPDVDAAEFLTALREKCFGMKNVSINQPDLFRLPKGGAPLDGWCLAFMSGPSGERIEFVQLEHDCNATKTFAAAARKFSDAAAGGGGGGAEPPALPEAQKTGPMVEHIVLIPFRKDLTAEELEEVTQGAYSLRKLPGVVSLTFGPSTNPQRSRGYTHGVVVRHENQAAADAYQVHPQHVHVRDKIMGPRIDKSIPVIALDFNIDEGAFAEK